MEEFVNEKVDLAKQLYETNRCNKVQEETQELLDRLRSNDVSCFLRG